MPRWRARCRNQIDTGARPLVLSGRDYHLLLDDEALDTADEERAVGVEPLGFGRGIGALHRGSVVVPELGDAVDLDIGCRNVGTRALGDNMRLHIATHPRHRVGKRRMHLEPVLDEVFVRQAVLTGQQSDALDHWVSPFVTRGAEACCAGQGSGGSMNIDLTGKRAIVAGGSRGIGRAIALAFAEAGAGVSICARGAERLTATREEIVRHGRTAHAAVCDLAAEPAVPRYQDRTKGTNGRLNKLVNNASGFGATDDEAG